MQAIVAEILSHAAEGALALPIRTVPLSAVSEAWTTASTAQERLVLVPPAAEAT